MKNAIVAMMFLLFLPLTSVYAVKLSSLYEVKIPVMSQQEEDRAAAVHDGFIQVLMKLSGNAHIDKTPAIREALKRADYYVQEYSYEPPTDPETNYNIKIRFEKTDMNRLLKRSSVSYWGEKRPLILVWLVTSNLTDDYQIIGNEETNSLLEALKTEGKKYGLPLIFPMMDMTDLDQVSSDDVANMKIGVLDAAGKRYAPDALLIGKVIDNKSELSSRWVLVMKGNSWEFTLSNASPDVLFSDLLNQVRQTLAKQMAVNEEAKKPIILPEQKKVAERDEMPEKLLQDLQH